MHHKQICSVRKAHFVQPLFQNKANGRGFRYVVGWIFFSVVTGFYLSLQSSVSQGL